MMSDAIALIGLVTLVIIAVVLAIWLVIALLNTIDVN